VVVSLDTADSETYAREKGVKESRFTDACDGIRWLSSGTATVGVSFLIHIANYLQMPSMLELARDLGATYTTFRPVIDTNAQTPNVCRTYRGWISTALPYLQQMAAEPDVEIDVDRFLAYRDWEGHGYQVCHGSQLNATITADGRVWVCPQRRGSLAGLMGDLRVEPFEAIVARHTGRFAVDAGCRVMCRLHPVNEQILALDAPQVHGAFV
jgi:MoaA/NifB/PqqE/SkfB family radical SAM enzyme